MKENYNNLKISIISLVSVVSILFLSFWLIAMIAISKDLTNVVKEQKEIIEKYEVCNGKIRK